MKQPIIIKHLYSFLARSALVLLMMWIVGCEQTGNNLPDVELLEGEWMVEEQSQNFKSARSSYRVYISISPEDSSRLIISNFYEIF